MVEKIIITPDGVRGYGNIVSQKTGADFTVNDCVLTVSSDTINGETMTVYGLEPDSTVLTVVLTVDDNSVMVGDTVTLSATVTDSLSSPVESASVSFKLGGTVLGSSTTNSSGVATYSYTCNTEGSLSFTASCSGNDSNSVSVTVTGHNYSLSFASSSYTTDVSGDVTVSAVLTDNGSYVSGATVTFTGGASTVTGTTDANGVASASVHFTSDGTLTATYSNVSDTATITYVPYLLYDDASADNTSSTFGSSYALRNGTSTVAWNSNGYYLITQTGSQRESMMQLKDLDGETGDFCIEYDSYVEQVGGSSGFVIYNSGTSWEKLTDDADGSKKYWYGYNNGSFHETAFYGSQTTYQKWVHYKYTLQGTTFTMEVTYNDNTVVTHTETIHFTRSSSTIYGLDSEWQRNTKTRYKNIVAYKI